MLQDSPAPKPKRKPRGRAFTAETGREQSNAYWEGEGSVRLRTDAYIERLVSLAPRLSADQLAKLAVIFNGGDSE